MFLIHITKRSYSIPVCFFRLNTQVLWDGECFVSSLLRTPNQVGNSKAEYLDTVNPGKHCCQLFRETHPWVELGTGAFCTWIPSTCSLFFLPQTKYIWVPWGLFWCVRSHLSLLLAALLFTLDEHPLMFILLICLLFIYRYGFASLPFRVTFGAKLSVRDSLRWLSIQSFLLCLFSWEAVKKEQTKGQLGLHSLNTVLFINISSEAIHEASQVMPTLGMGLPEE